MSSNRYASKRRARLMAHYPTVTLAEAMTLMAFGRSFAKDVLIRFRRRNRGGLPQTVGRALDAVGAQLAVLALDGHLVLRGERQIKDGASLEEAANIPREVFADGLHFEPSYDVIEMDCTLPRHFEGAGYPRYRHVRIDVRQIEPTSAHQEERSPAEVHPKAKSTRTNPKIERARQAIADVYPDGIPAQSKEPNAALLKKVGEKLKQAGAAQIQIGNDTILRAAGRRK